MTALKKNILWVDGLGGLGAGLAMLLLSPWLIDLYGLPPHIFYLVATANVLYGSYSTPLAMSAERPMKLLTLLCAANMAWPLVCVAVLLTHRETLTILGAGHLVIEGVYVGCLGLVEWRWRRDLTKR